MSSSTYLSTHPSIHPINRQLLNSKGGPGTLLSTGDTGVNKKYSLLGFPGGAVVGNLPASAADTGSSPGLGGSHMPRSGWAREPQLLSLRVWSLCSQQERP